MTRIAGISSLVYFAAALETSWNDVFIVSRHGRQEPLIPAVRQHAKVFVLTGGSESPAVLCRSLCDAGLGAVRVAIGCNLSYDDEVILRGTAADFTERGDDALAVMMIENDDARPWQRPVHGLTDEAFFAGQGTDDKTGNPQRGLIEVMSGSECRRLRHRCRYRVLYGGTGPAGALRKGLCL